MATEGRRQQRFEDAYLELLTAVERMGQWCQLLKPVFSSGGEPKVELPDFEQQARVQALVSAYGSKAVQQLYGTYKDVVQEMIRTSSDIDFAHQHGPEAGLPRPMELRAKLDMELRPREMEARRNLAEEIAAELAGDS